MALALLLLSMLIPVLQAKDPKWFEVSSEHFLLFTDTNEAKGRRLISDFENRVAAFSQAFGKVPARQFPIEIFLFNNEQDFIEALPHAQGEEQLKKAAYLLRGPDRTFIVAKDKSPDDIANDVGHGLGHVLFERYVLWRPFWLAEGAAEYVRKAGRSADTKAVSEQEGFSAGDVVTIVPSATYNDNDPGGAFRTESYRLLRILLDEKPDLIRQYLQSLRMESEHAPVNDIDAQAMDSRLKSYVETPLKMPPVTAALKSSEADMARLAIHRGDLLLATERQADASRWYNADSKDARAARAIITRFSRPAAEATRVLDRSARELPEYDEIDEIMDQLFQDIFQAVATHIASFRKMAWCNIILARWSYRTRRIFMPRPLPSNVRFNCFHCWVEPMANWHEFTPSMGSRKRVCPQSERP